MKKLAAIIALSVLVTTAFAQSSVPTPQSAADAQKEMSAVARQGGHTTAEKRATKANAGSKKTVTPAAK